MKHVTFQLLANIAPTMVIAIVVIATPVAYMNVWPPKSLRAFMDALIVMTAKTLFVGIQLEEQGQELVITLQGKEPVLALE